VEYVESKENPLMHTVRMHHYINWARCLKTELQKGTRQRTAKQKRQKKDGEGRGRMDNSTKNLVDNK
jgi:hypothetical protein